MKTSAIKHGDLGIPALRLLTRQQIVRSASHGSKPQTLLNYFSLSIGLQPPSPGRDRCSGGQSHSDMFCSIQGTA